MHRVLLPSSYTTRCACVDPLFRSQYQRHIMRPLHTNGDTSPTDHTTRRRFGQRYSIPEAAKALGLTEEAVGQRVKRGTLDSIKLGGNLLVLPETDVSKLCKKRVHTCAGRSIKPTKETFRKSHRSLYSSTAHGCIGSSSGHDWREIFALSV